MIVQWFYLLYSTNNDITDSNLCFYFVFQVVVPKAKGEILGVVIVESGWGSMLPTIVLANLYPAGPAARCGQLNIGDQVKTNFNKINYMMYKTIMG